MNQRRLITLLQQQVQESDSSMFGTRDRMERNLRYYTLEPLGNEQRGRSHYVSPDVHDYVQSKKALMSQTFLSNRQTVRFAAGGDTSPDEAAAKTAYCNKQLEAAGKETLFHDIWHDAFLSDRAVLMCDWQEDTDEEVINLQRPVPVEALMANLGGNVMDIDTSQAQTQNLPTVSADGMISTITMVSGTVIVVRQAGHFDFRVCEPENYYRDPLANHIKEAMWATFQDQIPRATLIDDGFDSDQVMALASEQKWRTDDVQFSRTKHNGTYVSTHKANRVDEQETVPVFKTYTYLNLAELGAEILDDDNASYPDEVRLYKICWGSDEVLRYENGEPAIEEVDAYPFFEWSELRLSHSPTGMSGSDVVAHSQKVNSVLKRAVIDNQNIVNNSRYEALYENLVNPRDLVDNTTGGVIWSEQMGSVAALPTPQLSPLTFNVLAMMREDVEARSGMSSLTKGMNTDVLRNQNAADMVERLSNSAGMRPTETARSFAQTFLIPLFKYMCDVAKAKDQSQDMTEQGGKQIQVAPSTWVGSADEMDVSVALTPTEAESHGQKLMVMHQVMSQDPVIAPLYGVQERHAMYDDIFDSMGVSDTTRYMKRPDGPEYQMQSQQVQQMQMMIQQLQGALQDKTQQLQLADQQIKQGWAQINNSMMDKMEDNLRQDREQRVEERQGDRKLDIEEQKASGQ